MPFLELFDETLDINSTANYELSVQMSQDDLSYTILDTIRNKYVLLRSSGPNDNRYFSSEQLGSIITRDDFLMKKFKKVSLVIPSAKFTLVPSPLFDPAKKEEYFSFNHSTDASQVIFTNHMREPDSFIVFSVPKFINDVMKELYPAIHPYHHTKPLLNQLANFTRSARGHYVHVHIENEFFNLFVFENNILKFSNSFNYRNISDILYFVLNTYKSMNISNEEAVHFTGITEKYDDIYSGFAMYIRNISFTPPSGPFTFSYVFNDIELHRYFNLFSLSACE
jgi:hypothetical protein